MKKLFAVRFPSLFHSVVTQSTVSRRLCAAALLVLAPTLVNTTQAHSVNDNAVSSSPGQPWSATKVEQILDRTLHLTLAPETGNLTPAETATVKLLLEVGTLLHDIYLEAQHKDALASRDALLSRLDQGSRDERSQAADLLRLFRIFKGPIATTLDNQRVPFLAVTGSVSGKNRYPWGITKQEITTVFEQFPASRDVILHPRSLVRRTSETALNKDLATLSSHPALDILHPGLRQQLKTLQNGLAIDNPGPSLYAVPYSVAYADNVFKAYDLLQQASQLMATDDPDFSDYLGHRARDLLSDNYEAGDASWITGRFNNLNAQIGAYETYDDGLFGTKAAFSMSLLVKDQQRSQELAAAITDLQALEDSLPYKHHKKVSSDIPVGVYNVIADFGQARGTNTASILPNESHITRKYGRTILLRYNIMTNQAIFDISKAQWDAVLAAPFDDDLTLQSNFQRTLWHEIGHYMGPSVDKQGRTLDIALANNHNLLEEMKSDLVSLFAAAHLRGTGYHTDKTLRSVYAGGILRTLQKVKPRRSQSYQTMQLMTLNYFLEQHVLRFDPQQVELSINYDKYPGAVKSLLTRLLDIQYQGDKSAADKFIDSYNHWDPAIHGKLAEKMRSTNQPRYRLVSYEAFGE